MEIKVTNWRISNLLKLRDKINDQPEYQRGKVWPSEKEALLIDSILRGIDLPKFYLRNLSNSIHDYEVADGQQRLTAIFNFYDNKIKLTDKDIKGLNTGKINNEEVGGKRFNSLSKELQKKFLNTEITVSIITDCTEDEVRILFGRLQEGVSLNAAEKRNAIISNVGKHIESIVLNHKFFKSSKISVSRFKQQDYLAQIFALILYNNSENLKATTLEKLYLDKSIKIDMVFLKGVDKTLDILHKIDNAGGWRLVNQYTFIDVFWFIYKSSKKIRINDFKHKYNQFENDRLAYRENLQTLLNKKTDYSTSLYNYIMHYDRSGSLKESIKIRSAAFTTIFKEFTN